MAYYNLCESGVPVDQGAVLRDADRRGEDPKVCAAELLQRQTEVAPELGACIMPVTYDDVELTSVVGVVPNQDHWFSWY